MNFTRQIADLNDDEFFQIGLTLYYNSEEIGITDGFNLWSIEKGSINEWTLTIKETDGFRRAVKATPYRYIIELNKT